MDKFVKLKIHGKPEQFFIVDYTIMDADQRVIQGGEGSLPPCPELVVNIRDWRSAYKAEVRHTRLEVVKDSITNSSHINHHELTESLQTNLNQWLSSSEFLPIRDKLMAGLNPTEVILVGIDINDPDLKYAPWHLWDFFQHFPRSDYALLRSDFKKNQEDAKNIKKNSPSSLNIMAIIGDSTGINTGEDTTIIKSLPGVNRLQILSEPSRQQVNEALWDAENTDILFFAGHGRKDQDKGRICINGQETLGVEEMLSCLKKQIQGGLQLAIFNSCEGLELGAAIEDLYIPQTIVMKEAVPDDIAQRFLKDFLTEFSQGVSLVQALRQTRNKLKDREHDYPYASWLPVLYCNPTEPLMQWQQKANFLERYPWQTKIAARCLLGLMTIIGIIGIAYKVSSTVNQNNISVVGQPSVPSCEIKTTPGTSQPPVTSSEVKTTKVYEEKSYCIKLEYPSNWVLQEKFDSITGEVINLFPADKPEVQLTLNIQDLSYPPPTLEQLKEKIVADLQKYSENFTLLQTEEKELNYKKAYKLTYTMTRQGIQYQAVDIFAQKGNKFYLVTYISPKSVQDSFTNYQSKTEKIIDSLTIVN